MLLKMINYSPLPSRVRRIVKVYDYCIEKVVEAKNGYRIELKEGYKTKDGATSVLTDNTDSMFYSMRSVVKPSTREIKVALYSFSCPICGKAVARGGNYADLGGLRICLYCNVQD
jgi:hypothetical protein